LINASFNGISAIANPNSPSAYVGLVKRSIIVLALFCDAQISAPMPRCVAFERHTNTFSLTVKTSPCKHQIAARPDDAG
jgi:hypothetical protein